MLGTQNGNLIQRTTPVSALSCYLFGALYSIMSIAEWGPIA